MLNLIIFEEVGKLVSFKLKLYSGDMFSSTLTIVLYKSNKKFCHTLNKQLALKQRSYKLGIQNHHQWVIQLIPYRYQSVDVTMTSFKLSVNL